MQRASNIAAALAISLGVLGLGGVHTVVVGGATLLALCAAALQIGHVRAHEHRVLVSLVGLSLGLAAVLCVAQLIPVPALVHEILNPHGLQIYEAGVALAGIDEDAWRPLSLDPTQTADRGLRYVALAAIALWGANVRGRRRWQVFAYGLVGLGFVVLGLGYSFWATGARSYFGLYEPTVGFRGPSIFISTNHGALFYGLVALVGMAAALRLRHDHAKRAAGLAVASVVLAGAALAMDSDAVTIALVLSGAAAAVIQWLRRGRPVPRRDVALGVAVLAGLGLIAAYWLEVHLVIANSVESAVAGGEHGGRVSLLAAGLAELSDFWRFGAGAGSVESVVPAYVDWSVVVPASIPLIENDPLEVLLSFGVPLGLLLVVAPLVQLGAIARHASDGQRSPRYAVALVAGLYLLLVAQVHFPLFPLGISLPAVAWFELLWSRRTRPSHDRRIFRTAHVALDFRGALALCAVLTGSALFVANAYFATFAPVEDLPGRAEIEREIRLRPSNHAPYVKLATAALEADDTELAVELADHAASRESSPRVRLYRAMVLCGASDARCSDAFRTLFAEGHNRGRYVEGFLMANRTAQSRAELLADYPEMWLDAAQRIQRLDGMDATSSFVVALAELRPQDVAVYRLGAVVYLRLGQPVLSELWAEFAHDIESTQNTTKVEAPLLLARALRASGRMADARRVLEEAMKNPALVRDAHRVAMELREAPNREILDFVQTHYDAFCVSPIPPEDQRTCWGAEAWLLETRGEHDPAARVYRRILRRLGDARPLAQYFQRNGRCDELVGLSRQLEPGAQRRAVEALQGRCATSGQ